MTSLPLPPIVHLGRDSFQVIRVTTQFVEARMVYFVSIWHRPYEYFMGQNVSTYRLALSFTARGAVLPPFVSSSSGEGPHPTPGLGYLGSILEVFQVPRDSLGSHEQDFSICQLLGVLTRCPVDDVTQGYRQERTATIDHFVGRTAGITRVLELRRAHDER